MIDLTKITTYPIAGRKNLVSLRDFLQLSSPYTKCKCKELKDLAAEVIKARQENKKTIVMFGAHLIKTGLSLYLIDLMKRGFVSHLATNGAGAIHDFEIALIGETSEDVSSSIKDGSFGMARETASMMNEAIRESSKGYGQAIGELIKERNLPHKEYSLFYWACSLKIPITVHVAVGTDVIHMHPSCDGACLGRASYQDFKTFTNSVSRLQKGVVINIGSAVILPEVFLKSLSVVRNLGYKVEDFTAANLDMIKHYRPTVNVVERPVAKGGKGFNIIGRHEQTIPTLYEYIMKSE